MQKSCPLEWYNFRVKLASFTLEFTFMCAEFTRGYFLYKKLHEYITVMVKITDMHMN